MDGKKPVGPICHVKLPDVNKTCALATTFSFNRCRSPAAMFQKIDFSVGDSSPQEVNGDPHERGYEADSEQPEIAVPVRVHIIHSYG